MNIEDFIKITKALSDSHRVRALLALRNGEMCVCRIISLLELAPSTVSKHMTVLRQAGLVASRKDSRWVYYRMIDEWMENPLLAMIVETLKKDKQIDEDERCIRRILKEAGEYSCSVPESAPGNPRKGR